MRPRMMGYLLFIKRGLSFFFDCCVKTTRLTLDKTRCIMVLSIQKTEENCMRRLPDSYVLATIIVGWLVVIVLILSDIA